ncbi:AraC family transcriptional regulator [Fulvivirga ulvae]|uniref:helix-turn-helix transcriptional regulator n=1 Tax=Fulvivirga ulvae TaxID=2904245 RepID=UPI001F437FD7|nr:AraC family transcriptional regulator [Fulvivirga ulvae]UII32043.1 AraC family transcriptional regulator [Fulvivirga ulvae]
MVLHHQAFDFGSKRLIEKITVKAPFRLSVNFPDEACFIYFEEGTTKVNSPYEQVAASSGESVLLKCGNYFADLQELATKNQYDILVVHLPRTVLKEIYKGDIPSFTARQEKASFISKINEAAMIREYIKSLNFYFEHPSVVNDELLSLKVKELVLLLIQTKNAGSVADLFGQLFTSVQIDIRQVVEAHIYSGISIEDMAALCHLSVSTFKRQFKKLLNDTPASYIKKKRLHKAKELLALSHLTISEIAYQTGFIDVAHFSNSFKAAYGCAPSLYRQKIIT